MIIFIHLGDASLPSCALDAMRVARRMSPSSEIVLIAAQKHEGNLGDLSSCVRFVVAEDLMSGTEFAEYRQRSELRFSFRDDFWFHTSARFFVLAEFMKRTGAEDVIHLENDVALYFDPQKRLDVFRSFAEFAVPLDRVRAVASFVWCANSSAAERLTKHMLALPRANDMESLGSFCVTNPDIAKPLPTIPERYAVIKGLDPRRYSQEIDRFGGVFDAAAIGQYIGGVHWLNNPHNTRFFQNESSDLIVRDFNLAWQVKEGRRYLALQQENVETPVLAIHAHSKDIIGISPFNHGVATDAKDMLTGERIQSLAELTVATPAIVRFHGRDNIRTPSCIEIPQNPAGHLLVPSSEFVESCQAARLIFVYTHLLLYFKRYIAPRLTQPFVLIVHNSDHSVGFDDLDLLNHPALIRCWAQNPEISHTRLSPLPIGLANRQWGERRVEEIVEVAAHISKNQWVYVNLSPTHPSRAHARAVAEHVPLATIETGVPFSQFLKQLASHRFCICPRGNGLDTHRFWEALYLDSIPVIVKSDWISSYSELPVLILNTWDDLLHVDWLAEYVRIKSVAYRFDRLSLAHFSKEFQAEFF